jgi:alanine racemase
LPVHVKIDTGMSRLGIAPENTLDFVRLIESLPALKLSSLYSHFATADDPNSATMYLQKSHFEQAIQSLTKAQIEIPTLHMANSAATLSDSNLHYDLVRVGLSLYGLYPANHLQSKISLAAALQVKARITHLKWVKAGTGISYGHQFISNRPMQIATVGIGYADGVPRNLSNRLKVLLKGQWIKQIGNITMDQLMLDVTEL